jgi:hypothetical protein
MRMERPMAAPSKKPKNLSLDPAAVARGERYSRLHGTSLSRLVGDFLRSLPLDPPDRPLTPVVRRLFGLAAGGKTHRDAYRRHLQRKYAGG